ncbi:hypothetical protein [Bacillus sp. 2205SS5-2]|uniref:hypothetical protein n=1 Tax=Bacillus sp. 2205SS5-2 TaxID=3109031 RepID=UPI003FA59988
MFGLKIYGDNFDLSNFQVIIRNITLPIVIVEMIVLFYRDDNKRIGDLLAKTYVK